MKVLYNGIEYEGKRFKDLMSDEIKLSTTHPDYWEGEEIFINKGEFLKDGLLYVMDCEITIISE